MRQNGGGGMKIDWTALIVAALASILSALAQQQGVSLKSDLSRFEARSAAHSAGRRSRFERIESELMRLRAEIGERQP